MATFLVLRAQPDADVSAAQIEKLGHTAIVAPLRVAEQIACPAPSCPDALIVTSANALRLGASLPADWHSLPFFCVGERSAALAKGIGFSDIRVFDNVGDLIALIADSELAGSRFLYLAGEPRRTELETAFSGQIAVWLRYRMVEAEKLPDMAKRSLIQASCDAVLHFSQHSAEVWFRLAAAENLQEQAFRPVQACISEAVADAVRGCAKAAERTCRIVVAKQMHGEGVISAALAAVSPPAGPQFD